MVQVLNLTPPLYTFPYLTGSLRLKSLKVAYLHSSLPAYGQCAAFFYHQFKLGEFPPIISQQLQKIERFSRIWNLALSLSVCIFVEHPQSERR